MPAIQPDHERLWRAIKQDGDDYLVRKNPKGSSQYQVDEEVLVVLGIREQAFGGP